MMETFLYIQLSFQKGLKEHCTKYAYFDTELSNETILYAEIDLSRNNEAKAALDTDGHYSRPDVFELHVNKDQRPGVVWDISSET